MIVETQAKRKAGIGPKAAPKYAYSPPLEGTTVLNSM
jgi:hypothetical protein